MPLQIAYMHVESLVPKKHFLLEARHKFTYMELQL